MTIRPLMVATAAAVLVLAGCGTAAGTGTPGPQTSAAVSPVFNTADVTFVRALIPHHLAGMRIAEQGVQHATRPEARTLAAAILATERDEVARLQGWLVTWNQPVAPPPSGEPSPAAGTSFDKAFANQLIAHQNAAIALARTEIGAGVNRDALAYAKQVDESRTAEIEQLRKWAA
jgi:uncharacterized protein (DUF305 family)